MKKLRIDHFDGNYAICEDEDGNNHMRIPKYQLPLDSKDGDLLYQMQLVCINYMKRIEFNNLRFFHKFSDPRFSAK